MAIYSGVYEIQIAPSNTNILYMQYEGYVFKSTNKGTSWTQTSFPQVSARLRTTATASFGQKMAIDPNNPNIVYVGTPLNGLFVSTNGGTTWQQVSQCSGKCVIVMATATSLALPVYYLIPPSAVSDGATQTIFAESYGKGVYESTNGGTTWTAKWRPDRRAVRGGF